jgi:hypothetical protein
MNRIPSTAKTMALAVALALPAAPTFAASMSDLVTTREDQNVHQQFGRDSVYAMQTHQPAQIGSRISSDTSIGKIFAGIGAAGATAWDKMTSVFGPGSPSRVAEQPQWYGRAGGYVGNDQLALLERAGPATDASQPVIAGEAMAIAPAERDVRYPAASESQLYGRNENRLSHTTETAPAASGESMSSANEPVTSEQPATANDVRAPAATESQPYGREGQPYGRNEEQLSESAAPAPGVVPSEPSEQPSAANEATLFGRDEDEVYESATAGEAAGSGSEKQADNAQFPADQSATEQEGAGEAAQSAPSPDSVTVLDEEKRRGGEQPADQASGSERSSGRL